ncbi:MAG: hypothetical protein QME83_09785 [Thermodesulfobacteriota bacterium]|nr:hypothetical protein [Thermodesulfobacteriota bacterium]
MDGTVTIICPECGENWEEGEIPGCVECPECKYEFEVDEDGNSVIDEKEEEDQPKTSASSQTPFTSQEPFHTAEFTPLLEAARPELYSMNAFRICESPIDATVKDILQQAERINLTEKFGTDPHHLRGPLALNPVPDMYAIQEAMQRLNDPERRLVDELFWFWPHELGQGKTDDILKTLSRGNIKKAAEMWIKQENYHSESNVSMHNLAVLYHAAALDLELSKSATGEQKKLRDLYWQSVFKRWKILLDYEGFWSRLAARIRDFGDPRLTTGTARKIRASLPLALLSINAQLALRAAKSAHTSEVQRQSSIMQASGFEKAIIDEALRRIAEPTREQIKILCKKAQEEASSTPIKALELARLLIDQTKPLLTILDYLLSPGNATRDAAHDQIALQALTCLVTYVNNTEGWRASLSLLKQTLSIAASESVKKKIEGNIEIVNTNAVYKEFLDPIYNECNHAVSKANEGYSTAQQQLYYLRDHIRPKFYAFEKDTSFKEEVYQIAANIIAGAFRELALCFNNDHKDYSLAYEAIQLADLHCRDKDLSERIKNDRSTINTNKNIEETQKKPTTQWCFIATAAYGDPYSYEVNCLRRFRDNILSQSSPGRIFTRIYYRLSPPLASLLSNNEQGKAIARWLLGLLVAVCVRHMIKKGPISKGRVENERQ